jgi:hypothetical protein
MTAPFLGLNNNTGCLDARLFVSMKCILRDWDADSHTNGFADIPEDENGAASAHIFLGGCSARNGSKLR